VGDVTKVNLFTLCTLCVLYIVHILWTMYSKQSVHNLTFCTLCVVHILCTTHSVQRVHNLNCFTSPTYNYCSKTQLILLIQKMDKKLPVQKVVSSTNSCLQERKKLYLGRVAGTIFQLSARLPRLLSPLPEFFLSVCISHR